MKKILFFYKPYGRLGNRLWRYSNLAAWCWDNGFTLWDPTLSDYANLFPTFQGDPLFSINFQKKRTNLTNLSRKLFRFLIVNMASQFKFSQLNCDNRKGRYFELDGMDGKTWLNENSNNYFISIEGFWYSSGDLKQKYRERLAKMFSPKIEISEQINKKLANIDSKKILIGIHIRQTDYRNFLNGDGYYSLIEYQDLIKRLLNRIGEHKVQFIISSDEHIPETFVNGLPITIGLGTIQDIFTLSYCDLIIGPRSTFSNWSAFVSNKQLIELWGHPIWKQLQENQLNIFLSNFPNPQPRSFLP